MGFGTNIKSTVLSLLVNRCSAVGTVTRPKNRGSIPGSNRSSGACNWPLTAHVLRTGGAVPLFLVYPHDVDRDNFTFSYLIYGF
jgi:hypothetical protein